MEEVVDIKRLLPDINDVGQDAMELLCLLENKKWDSERIYKACKFLVDMDEAIETAITDRV